MLEKIVVVRSVDVEGEVSEIVVAEDEEVLVTEVVEAEEVLETEVVVAEEVMETEVAVVEEDSETVAAEVLETEVVEEVSVAVEALERTEIGESPLEEMMRVVMVDSEEAEVVADSGGRSVEIVRASEITEEAAEVDSEVEEEDLIRVSKIRQDRIKRLHLMNKYIVYLI